MHPTRYILATSVLALIVPSTTQADVLAAWNFGTVTSPQGALGTNPGTAVPSTVGTGNTVTNITNDTGLSAIDLSGSQGTPPPTTPWLRESPTATAANYTVAITNHADFTFTLTANAGFILDLSSITFDAYRGGTSSTRGFALLSSADNFATPILTQDLTAARGVTGGVNNSMQSLSIPSLGSIYQNLAAITFRMYIYANGTGSVEFDNIVVNGTDAVLALSGYTWTGATNSLWNTTDDNWSGSGSVSGTKYVDAQSTSDVIFGSGPTNTAISIQAGGVSPHSITLNSATSYSFSNGPITVGTTLTKTGNGTLTINNALSAPLVLDSGGNIEIGAGGTVTSPSLSVGAGGNLLVDVGGMIGSTSALSVAGNATLSSSQTVASLDGATTGVLTLGSGVSLAAGGTSTYNGKITGAGSLIKNSAGTLTLAGTSDFTGGTTISGGGAIILTGAASGGAGTGLTVQSNGKLVLGSATNPTNFTTAVTLNGGTLGSSTAGQQLAATVNVTGNSTISSTNVLSNTGSTDVIITGTLGGTGNINIGNNNGTNPDGTGVRFRGPNSTYSGTITVPSASKVEIQPASATGSPIGTGTVVLTAGTMGGPGTPDTSQVGTFSLINIRNNVGTIAPGNPINMAGTGTALINILGTGAAGSTVTMGNLQIGDNQTLAASATTGPTTMILAFPTVHLTGGNASFVPGFNAAVNDIYVTQHSISLGPISDGGTGAGITMKGNAKLILTGANTYTGATNVQTGTLVLAAGSSISSSSAVTISTGAKIDATALPTMSVPATQTLTVSGTLDTNVGGITPGTINLSGTLRGGGDAFSNGLLKATVIAASGATVSPGVSGPGLLTGQNIDLQTGSNFVVDVSKAVAGPGNLPTPGVDFDQFTALDYSGGAMSTVHLAGNLALNVGTGLEPGDVFTTIISNQSFNPISGTFQNLPEGAIFASGGQAFQISYAANDGNDVSLQVVPEPATALLLLGTVVPFALRRRRR